MQKITKNQNRFAMVVGLLIALFVVTMTWLAIIDKGSYQVMADKIIQERENASLNMQEPKYTVKKTFNLTHSDGTPQIVKIVKFHCCNNVGGFVKDGVVYLGYLNEVMGKPITAKKKEMIPDIKLNTALHELHHTSLIHNFNSEACFDKVSQKCLERTAYDFETLAEQLFSLQEDQHIKLSY